MAGSSLMAQPQQRASRQLDDTACAFINDEADANGISETVTWGQVHQRVQVVAEGICVVSLASRVLDTATRI